MKNIYILDEFQSSKQNGVGVFIKELVNILKRDFNLSIIYTNSDTEEFCIKKKDNITLFCIPKIPKYPFSTDAETTNLFISLWVKDSRENVFIVNHSPCAELLKLLKETHPLSKIIFVVHDLACRLVCQGDLKKYTDIIGNRHDLKKQKKHAELIKIFEKEIEMFTLADKIVCLSEDTYSLLLNTYKLNRDKISIIYNGMSDLFIPRDKSSREKIRDELHIDKNEKIILYVGRVNKTKGGDVLLKCFSDVLKKLSNSRILIIGNFDSKDTIREIGNNACKISFTGHIEKEKMCKWYSVADIGVIASYAEQCSYSAIEMMMSGLPIVASNGYGVQNMFKEGENAVVARIGNRKNNNEYCKNMSSAILTLLKSEDLQKKLGETNRALFKNIYTTTRMGERYKKLIESLDI